MTKLSRDNGFSWNLYAAAILLLFVFFQIMQWPLLPKFLDIYYHLFAMKGFATAGGYPTIDFWENAPAGRPHLYPPLLHFFMLLLYRTGLSVITIGRLADAAIYPLLLGVFWFVVRRVYSPRVAFLALLLCSSSYSAYLASVTLAPFSLGFLFGFLVFLDLQEGKSTRAIFWMGLSFYSHMLAAWTFFAGVILYGMVSRKGKDVLKIALGSLFIAAPLLWHEFQSREYFHFVKAKENLSIEIDLMIYLLAFSGLFVVLKKKRAYFFPFILIVSEFFFLSSHRFRFFSGHGLFILCLLGAFSLDACFERLQKHSSLKVLAGTVLSIALIFYLAAPILMWDLKHKKIKTVFFDRSVTRYVLPDTGQNFRAKGFTIYFEKEYEELVRVVRQHSDEDDIIWSDFAHGAGLIAILADRVTSSAMLPEVKPFKETDAIQAAKLSIWYKNPDALDGKPKGMGEAIKKYNLSQLAETDLAYVYENPYGFSKRTKAKPAVSETLLYLLAALYLAAMLFLTRASIYNIMKKIH